MKGIGVSVDKLVTRTRESGIPCDKPDNMVVGVNKRTGLLHTLKRSKKSIQSPLFLFKMLL